MTREQALEALVVELLTLLDETQRQHRVTSAASRRANKTAWERRTCLQEKFSQLGIAIGGLANAENHD